MRVCEDAPSSSVCVDASTYTGFGFGVLRAFVFDELPEVLRATPWLCSRCRAEGEGSGCPRRFCNLGQFVRDRWWREHLTEVAMLGVLRVDPALFRFPRFPLCCSSSICSKSLSCC